MNLAQLQFLADHVGHTNGIAALEVVGVDNAAEAGVAKVGFLKKSFTSGQPCLRDACRV